ncbi:uncharacterized protein LOC104855239 [Fukomys damarensis]|uniref:uncharacterized protein LOC104855239 n=1 Tax=Fukomys damarensis TaxID=885580 RepID=UPI00053F3458|nr:uncharacterized protein LOC104855239 [Fukomys damarensis]
MLCCFPRSRGRSLRTPRRESTWERVRGWMTKSRRNRPLGRNRSAHVGSTGQVSPDPEALGPEMRGSHGQASLGLETRHSEKIGNQEAESLAEVCAVRTAQTGRPHTLSEPPEQAFPDSCPINGPSFQEPTRACISSPQEGSLESSMSSVIESFLQLQSQVYHTGTLLLAQLERYEPTETEPKREEQGAAGPAPAEAEVPVVELTSAPPAAAPCPALAAEPQPAPGTPSPPAAQLGLMVTPQLPLGPAPVPHLPFSSITRAFVLFFTFAAIFWIFLFGHQILEGTGESSSCRRGNLDTSLAFFIDLLVLSLILCGYCEVRNWKEHGPEAGYVLVLDKLAPLRRGTLICHRKIWKPTLQDRDEGIEQPSTGKLCAYQQGGVPTQSGLTVLDELLTAGAYPLRLFGKNE